MLRTLFLSLMTALTLMAAAQTDLVPNGSFEDTINCTVQVPHSLLQAAHWSSPNTATPDLYDCDLDRLCGQAMDPDDLGGIVLVGFQYAKQGYRLAGGVQWYGAGVPSMQDTRDYLMVKLTDAMEADRSYAVSLYCSRAEGFRYAIDHIGVYFGADSIYEAHPVVLNVVPQVALRDPLNPYLTEGVNWVQLVDTFVALGGERWMVIGTFDGSDEVDGIVATPSSTFNYAYYYFDQVEVRALDGANSVPEWSVWYAGSGSVCVDWRNTGSLDQLNVFDPAGRLLYEAAPRWDNGRHTFQLPGSLASGIYLIEVKTDAKRWVKRLIKEEGMF